MKGGTLTFNLCTGGLNSYIAWKLFAPHSENVYVRLGHRYERRELFALNQLKKCDSRFQCAVLPGPDLSALERADAVIPCRNAILLSVAAAHAASREPTSISLLFGVTAGEENADKTVEFMSSLRAALGVSLRRQPWTDGVRVSVGSLLRPYSKQQLVSMYAGAGLPLSLLSLTASCSSHMLHDEARHCGFCAACLKRKSAFGKAGVRDETLYLETH